MGLYYCFPFYRMVLQAQKLIALEGIVGAEVKAEEQPKGETIVGSGGEVLRPPGMYIISFLNKFSLFLGCISMAAPLL